MKWGDNGHRMTMPPTGPIVSASMILATHRERTVTISWNGPLLHMQCILFLVRGRIGIRIFGCVDFELLQQ